MASDILGKIKRGIRKPPKVILSRLFAEMNAQAERFRAPYRSKKLNLLKATASKDINELWGFLSSRPYLAYTNKCNQADYEQWCPGGGIKILTLAEQALQHKVNLLGSGLVSLGAVIDWYKDYKSGFSWPCAYIKSIDYRNPERPSDVKFPWEVSRMQWLIPVGQAYLLTGNEKYALAVKEILSDWIDKNPYAYSINWACTMDVALRLITWTWFFHAFKNSVSWNDGGFRKKFIHSLFLHADFTARNLECSDVNGNHYTADAAGLVFAGLFFGRGQRAECWQKLGWNILNKELPRQVFLDGVDFEASIAYHRLVQELFLLPAFYRLSCGLDVPAFYQERLIAMAHFTVAYSRNDGTTPFWGDADDARTLPFGDQDITDHRYLIGLTGCIWKMPGLLQQFSGSASEIFWLLGPAVAKELINYNAKFELSKSSAFPEGGFYIMRNTHDHVFIDCGPLGLAGRGGHGHNDCLAFEAVLNGERLIADCGAYLYTASYEERNNFRSTAYHNTPQIDNEEINRFIRWDYLWNLHNDAKHMVMGWETGPTKDIFCGSHTGYERLSDPVFLKRTITLNHLDHDLCIEDEFNCEETHLVAIPLHLFPEVDVQVEAENNAVILISHGKSFRLTWEESDWQFSIQSARISPSYGVVVSSRKLLWEKRVSGYTQFNLKFLPIFDRVESLKATMAS